MAAPEVSLRDALRIRKIVDADPGSRRDQVNHRTQREAFSFSSSQAWRCAPCSAVYRACRFTWRRPRRPLSATPVR